MAGTAHKTFAEFLERNPDLTSKSLMTRWYSEGRMTSSEARHGFLMPDRFQA